MTDTISSEVIQEKMDHVSGTLNAILSGGGEGYLRELQGLLQKNLTGLLSLFDRNPDLDAATSDFYAAAAAIVNDIDAESQPLARKRRLLREAQARFEERIRIAEPNRRKPSAAWCKNEIFLAA
ncbi:hypothetical protein BB934_43740 (plasmid) [Microvirga ossetica]|uniref:Uncharacterized protein n=1 Tax=Microvirga ossetica TaxID=1882682 RepID=A0A1B2EYP0_9HYPH|nr:hypothetical protein [Microvirga ossetica]ANY85114.1 hypothetical protein BB934_43740 [Microvirga ossetica]